MVKSIASTYIVAAQLALVISSVAGIPIDITERDITELEPRAHGFGDDIIKVSIKHTSTVANEAVKHAINDVVSGTVTGPLTNQYRRDLDAIKLEPRTHGVGEAVVKVLKKHGSRIAGEAVDQAVSGAVQAGVTSVTQRLRRDLKAIELERRAHGVGEAVVKVLKKHGSRIAGEAVDQAVSGAVQAGVTAVTQRLRRDLDAIELESRAHGVDEAVVKVLKKHGSRIAGEVVDQAVSGAVQAGVTAVTQRQRRDLDYNVKPRIGIVLNRRTHGVKNTSIKKTIGKGVRKQGSRILGQVVDQAADGIGQAVSDAAGQAVTRLLTPKQQRRDLDESLLGARGYEGLNELD